MLGSCRACKFRLRLLLENREVVYMTPSTIRRPGLFKIVATTDRSPRYCTPKESDYEKYATTRTAGDGIIVFLVCVVTSGTDCARRSLTVRIYLLNSSLLFLRKIAPRAAKHVTYVPHRQILVTFLRLLARRGANFVCAIAIYASGQHICDLDNLA